MNFLLIDNFLSDPDQYVRNIHSKEFGDFVDGAKTYKNIQPGHPNDEFSQSVMRVFGPSYEIAWNFVRKSPHGQQEPNFIHSDEKMGDVTVILFLSKEHPQDDGTTIYNRDGTKACVLYSKYNRVVAFESHLPHSRNIFENFGQGESARLVQVIFLKKRVTPLAGR